MSGLNMPVEEFTTPNPVTADESTSLTDLLALMKRNEIRHLLIVRGEEVVGVVSERDIKVAQGLSENEKRMVRAADIMAPNPVTVEASDTLDEVAFKMSASKIGSVIVNENGNLLGIFTVTDALNALIEIAREAEENA